MSRLPRSRRQLAVVGIIAALAATAVVSPALGGPNFLTLTKAKRVFVTKKQANRKYLQKRNGFSRSQANARFLDNGEGNAAYLARSGTTRIQISPDDWISASTGATADHFTGAVDLRGAAAGTEFFNAAMNLPAILQGRPISIENFEMCYDATNANATLDWIFLTKLTPTPANIYPLSTHVIEDQTDEDDATCRTYTAPNPIPIGPDDLFQFVMRVSYSGAGWVRVSRLTLNLST